MGIETFQSYDSYLSLLESYLSIWGQTCSVFIPYRRDTLGYENQSSTSETAFGVKDIANKYQCYRLNIFIDFKVTKNVQYHFNYFPDKVESLSFALMSPNSLVHEESFIRTAVPGQTSIWGDMIFKVQHIGDDGKYKTLRRVYFLRPVVDAQLNILLDVNKYEASNVG